MSTDMSVIERTKDLFYHELAEEFKALHGFHQGTGRNWLYKEFWTKKEIEVLSLAEKLADLLQIELHLEGPSREWTLQNT